MNAYQLFWKRRITTRSGQQNSRENKTKIKNRKCKNNKRESMNAATNKTTVKTQPRAHFGSGFLSS